MAVFKQNPFEQVLDIHPCTLAGLRAAFAVEKQRLNQEHIEAAQAAQAKKKTVPPGKPGAADYSAEAVMCRPEVLQSYFESILKPSTRKRPLLAISSGEEDTLIELLLGHFPPYAQVDVRKRIEELLPAMPSVFPHIGEFGLRFANTSHGQTFYAEEMPPGPVPAAICSLTVHGTVRATSTFNATKSLERAALQFLSQPFVYEGRSTCLHLEIAKGDSDFLQKCSYLSEQQWAPLRRSLCTRELKDGVPMVAWPVGTSGAGKQLYHSLTPVPSVAVLDSMARQFATYVPNSDVHTPQSIMAIGGSNPQNAGPLNSAVMGKHRIFRSVLSVSSGKASSFLSRFVWNTDWLRSLSFNDVAALARFNPVGSRDAKESLVQKVAEHVVAVALSRATDAVEYLDLGTTEVPPALKERLEKNEVYLFLTQPSPQSVERLVPCLMGLIAKADKDALLLASADLRTRLTGALREALVRYDETPSTLKGRQ